MRAIEARNVGCTVKGPSVPTSTTRSLVASFVEFWRCLPPSVLSSNPADTDNADPKTQLRDVELERVRDSHVELVKLPVL
jgi:hypothetical protein